MPVECVDGHPTYRIRTTSSGKRTMLVFCHGKVVEAKRLRKKNRGKKNAKSKNAKKNH